jgi:hypothetical protein
MLLHFIADCIVLLGFWWMLLRTSKQLRTELRTEIDLLSNKLRALPEQASEHSPANGNVPRTADIQIIPAKSAQQFRVSSSSNHEPPQISRETEEAIKATLSAFLGQTIRIRSVKLVENRPTEANWVTQGRMAIQASHSQIVARG